MDIRPNFFISSYLAIRKFEKKECVTKGFIDEVIKRDEEEIEEAKKHIDESGIEIKPLFDKLSKAMNSDEWDKLHEMIVKFSDITGEKKSKLFSYIDNSLTKSDLSIIDKVKTKIYAEKIKNNPYYELYKECVKLEEKDPTVLSAVQFIISAKMAIEKLKSLTKSQTNKRK